MPIADPVIHAAVTPQRIAKNGMNVREDTLYTDARGKQKSRIRKRADRVIERLGEFLARVLEKDEAIFYVTRAQVMPGTLEQLFLGWHLYALPNVFLVFTSRRIISLRIRGKGFRDWQWDRGVRTVRWGDVESAHVKGILNRVFTVKLRSGEKLCYWRIKGPDPKKINLLVDVLRPQSSGENSASGITNSLCPDCLSTLTSRHYDCAQCRLRFKDERTLMWRGILIPGGASFYIGLTSLGVLRFIFESLILLSILGRVFLGIMAGRASEAAATAWAGALFLLLVLLFEKWVAIYSHRRQIRDFLPAK